MGRAPRRRLRRTALSVAVAVSAATAGWAAAPGTSGATTSPAPIVVTVDTTSANGTASPSLEAGTAYTFTASGAFRYLNQGVGGSNPGGAAESEADAECTELRPDRTFQRNRFVLLEPGGDLIDLFVNGAPVEWQAQNPDAFGCDPGHVYTLSFTPTQTGPVTFAVHEYDSGGYGDNAGALTVTITPSEVEVDAFDVFASAPNGATSAIELEDDRRYRIEASGTWFATNASLAADAECTSVAGAPGTRLLFGPLFNPTDPSTDHLDLYVNGRSVEWAATGAAGPVGCDDTTHAYRYDIPAGTTGVVRLHVNDTFHGDNQGRLSVRILDIGAAAGGGGVVTPPNVTLAEEVTVDSRAANGASTLTPLQAGKQYLLEAVGTYFWGAGMADAECSTALIDPVWLPDRFASVSPTTDLLDVLVNQASVDWVPTARTPDGCNEATHTYRLVFVPSSSATVNFRVADGFHGDNGGTIAVRVYVIDEVPIGTFVVPADNPNGTAVPLVEAGRTYRLAARGQYGYYSGNPALRASAECSTDGVSADHPNRYAGQTSLTDALDLYVGGSAVDWTPMTGPGPCAADHRYQVVVKPTGTSLGLAVADVPSSYADNTGSLTVEVFRRN